MASDKDIEQDALIRQNAEHIRRNEEAILRQTVCLEKIRDHYFPKKTVWKQTCGLFLKVVGAVTVAAGLLEAAEWCWNTRKAEVLAARSVAVAKRLMFVENDMAGAKKFLDKAVELDGESVKYRIIRAYVNGLMTLGKYHDVGRPLQTDEYDEVNDILAEAVFLQEASPDEAMPNVLAAQAYVLRGELDAARKSVDRAIELAPDNVFAHISSCAIAFASGEIAKAKSEIAEAMRLNPRLPLVHFWHGMLAEKVDHDLAKARGHYEDMLKIAPRMAMGRVVMGRVLMSGERVDFAAARAEFELALKVAPTFGPAVEAMAELYEAEGNCTLALLWLDRALRQDGRFMRALTTRARVYGKTGEWKLAVADLTSAIELAPFRADLYRERAAAYEKLSEKEKVKADLELAEAITKGGC